ncbi:MAG: NAD(P)/FAD-dependent oxidoreductase [Halobacteriota archaeon]|nr:NAD(P)/FAD-dependent oxidoreductase [Halobacteriota archaeon]
MKDRYDVLIIGGGPAGSICAKTCADQGLDVLMVEKRQEIGVPVRCAEGIGKVSLHRFIQPDKKWICAEVIGANIFAPDGTMVTMSEEFLGGEVGYVLERKIFDRVLVHRAIDAGAEVMVKTSATGLLRSNGTVTGAKIRQMGDIYDVKADVVIGADGVESKVGRWGGIDTTLKPIDIDSCAQFLMTDVDVDPEYIKFYLSTKIAYGGYAWVFPKGDNCANVGLGIPGSESGDQKRAYDHLLKFVEKFVPGAKVLEMIFGGVPLSAPLDTTVGDGLILVGDAARFSDPITGGGIANAMKSGEYAGKIIVNAMSEEDLTAERFKEYERLCYNDFGKTNTLMYKVKGIYMKWGDEELNSLAHSLKDLNVTEITGTGLLRKLAKENPKLLSSLKDLFT